MWRTFQSNFPCQTQRLGQILIQWSKHWSEQIHEVAAGTAVSAGVHKGGLCRMLMIAAEDKMQLVLEADPRG